MPHELLPQLATRASQDVAKQLSADTRLGHTVLIAVTGWGSASDQARSREARFDEHLTKPVDRDDLEALLSRAGV